MLSDARYYPSLFIRNSEMRALDELPAHEKDLIIPTIMLRPWVGSKTLEKSLERVEKAFPGRPYFLEIDRFYVPTDPKRKAISDFIHLRNPDNYEDWFAFAGLSDFAIPCLRLDGADTTNIRKQIRVAEQSERGFMFRVDKSAGHDVSAIVEAASSIDHANYIFSADAGWNKDLLSDQLWMNGTVRSLGTVRPEVPVIVTGSSFPDAFGMADPIATRPIRERPLFDAAVAANNAVRCLYGDWASARPPSPPAPMTPVPRIDIPGRLNWTFFRYKTDDGGYKTAAATAMQSDEWDESLNIWGTYLVRATANGHVDEITYPGIATAARINLHLHRQANFDDPIGFLETEDDFED